MAAAAGTTRAPIAQQACDNVEAAIALLDRSDFWPEVPTQTSEASFEQELNFARGCDLALQLLRAQEASVGQDVCCWRRHREGRPQFRFWKPFIEQLIEAPELIDGFDAVMSASREDGMCITANELARVATEEYEAGEVGADGTVSEADADAHHEAAQAAAPNVEAETDHDDEVDTRRRLAFDCNFEISKLAHAVKKLITDSDESPVFNGIMGRIEQLTEINFFVMRLYGPGETDEVVGAPSLQALQRVYKGMLP